ncbi:Kinesin-like protein, partial [Globisporangium splendens]
MALSVDAAADVTHSIGAKRKKGGDDSNALAWAAHNSTVADDDNLLPHAKRMRMATAAGQVTHQSSVNALPAAPGSARFGFGFKPPATFAKAPQVAEPPAATASNQAEREQPKVTDVKVEAAVPEQIVRGRGQLTAAEKAIGRPNARKMSNPNVKLEPEEHGVAAVAPRSSGRNTVKQKSASTASLLTRAPSLTLGTVLPTPTPRSAIKAPKSTTRSAIETDAQVVGTENNDLFGVAQNTRVRDAFSTTFAENRVESLEELLKFRSKASKFNAKARQDEQVGYIRQLKTAVRAVCDEIRTFDSLAATMDDKIHSERAILERRLAILEESMKSKDLIRSQFHEELNRLRYEKDSQSYQIQNLLQENARLQEAEQQSAKALVALEENANQLQKQLLQAQKQNDELTLELKSHQATLTDRVQLYEEKKKELQHFYERKDTEEEKRKSLEIERLQTSLSNVREELAAVNKEKDNLKDRAKDCENELKQERERRTHLELEKRTLEAQNQSLEMRCTSISSETAELKAKLTQKEEEIMKMLTTMTEIQKFTTSANTKLEAEKKDLLEKIDALQKMIRDFERAEVENAGALREAKSQLEANTLSRAQAEEKEREASTQLKDLEQKLQESARQISVEIGIRQMLENQARELRNEHVAVNAQMEAIRSEMKGLQMVNEESKRNSNQQIAMMEERFENEKKILQKEIEQLQEDKVSFESEVKTLRERVSTARDGDLEELCEVKREAEVLRLRLKELSNQGMQSLAQKDRLIEELQEKVKAGDKMRRIMHNTIQELRGNVRVFARTRPFLPSDRLNEKDPDTLVPAISCEYDGQTMKLKRPGKTASGSEPESYTFSFDKVFAPSMGQDAVFEEVSEFVQSSLDGYHVCLFSYGQTGSGKTHTMQGSGIGQMRGIIPRSIEKVLHECEVLKLQGWNYTVQVSFLEIYNETLKDLLAGKDSGDSKLGIKKDAKGGVYVPDLTMVDVTAMEQVEALMERASRARSVACTDMNAQSSRSHSVFTLHLQGVNEAEGVSLDGKLNLVDLAGSERASRSNVSGDRLKETQAINKSLSCLADVFTAIGNKSSHPTFFLDVANSDPIPQLEADLFAADESLWRRQDADDGEFVPDARVCKRESLLAAVRQTGEPVRTRQAEAPDQVQEGSLNDGAENGGVLTPEEQAKLFLSDNRSLQMQLAERHDLAVKAMESKRELQERVSDLQRDFERERIETFGITQDMTRQYKSMQEELLNRINTLENTNTELRDQLELARVNFEEMKREKDRVIAAKNVEIQELKAKMEEMAQEFGEMFKETLDKMRERIEITNTSFEVDGGMPLMRCLEESNLGSPAKI